MTSLLFWLVMNTGMQENQSPALPKILTWVRSADFLRAETPLRALVEQRPAPVFLYLLGLSLQKTYRAAEAEPYLRRAVAARPDRVAWLKTLAECLAGQGRFEEAHTVLDQALEIEDVPMLHYTKARFALETGDPERAEAELNRTLAADPDHFEAGLAIARLGLERGAVEPAKERLLGLLAQNPDHRETLYLLGLAYVRAGDEERAGIRFRQLLVLFPQHLGANYNLARLFQAAGSQEEAGAYFDEVRGLLPLEEAIQNQRCYLDLDPGNPAAHRDLGALLLKIGKPGEAWTHLSLAAVLDPQNAETQRVMAETLRVLDRQEEAVKAERRAKELEAGKR